MTAHLLEFLAIAAVVIVTPGQDTVLTIRNTLQGGRRSGVATALGVVTGQAAWTLAASVGLVAVLRASEAAFAAVRFAGAAYLVWLGAQGLFAAFRPGRAAAPGPAGAARKLAPRAAYRQGVLSNLGNAKMAVFFSSLLPQFAPPGQASIVSLMLLGLVFCSMTLVWLTGYAFAVARAGDVLARRGFRRALDGACGATLVGFGLRLATGRR